MKLGILGGTFDPIHHAHLILADQTREELGLDRVLLMVAGQPPHKPHRRLATPKQRYEMARLAVAGDPNIEACDIEIKRAGPSYTVDTLRVLHQRYDEAEFVLILGADAVADLPNWREPLEILRLASIAVAARAGTEPDLGPLRRLAADAEVEQVTMPALGLSSRVLRERLAQGKSIRYRVPPAVEAYIDAEELYRDAAASGAGS